MTQLTDEQQQRLQRLVDQLSGPDFVCDCKERLCIHWQVYAVKVLSPLLDSDSHAAETRYAIMAQALWAKFWDDPTSDRWSTEDIANVLRAADASGDAAVGAGLSSPCEADSISGAAQSAATRMRDKCVAKVKALKDGYDLQGVECAAAFNYDGEWKSHLKAATATEVITALESLTLDQEQET